uniref:BAR/IMD domain containing adaptor protein 2 like 2a n=1 Tax=Poecilia formosa TaxID=48698 RepID=A0A087XJB9_POEFO
MSGINGDQLHRSTLGIYSSLTDELNPSLQKLLSLGNHFARAFRDLVVSSEAYFTALSKIGEKAFYSSSSRSLGDVLIQIADSQRRLTKELEGVFRNFSVEVLQVMESSVQMDFDYISHSRVTYEREVHKQAAAAQQRQRRGGTGQICTVRPQEYLQFLKESHQEALQEEDRRYRFLAEKHCGLVQSLGLIMNKMSGPLLQKTDVWTEEVDATRRAELQRPAAVDNAVSSRGSTGGMRAEDIRQIREEMTLGKIPSRAPSPVGSIYRSRAVTMRAKAPHQPSGSNPTLLPFSKGQIITVKSRQPRNGWLYGYAENGSGQGWFPASYVEEVDDPPMSSSSCYMVYVKHNIIENPTSSASSTHTVLICESDGNVVLLRKPLRIQAVVHPETAKANASMMTNFYILPQLSSKMSSASLGWDEVFPLSGRRAEAPAADDVSPAAASVGVPGQPSLTSPPLSTLPAEVAVRKIAERTLPEVHPGFLRGTNPFATVKLKPTHTNDRSAPILY